MGSDGKHIGSSRFRSLLRPTRYWWVYCFCCTLLDGFDLTVIGVAVPKIECTCISGRRPLVLQ